MQNYYELKSNFFIVVNIVFSYKISVSGKPVSSTAYAFFVIIQVVKYFISWACGYYLAVIQTMAGIHQK